MMELWPFTNFHDLNLDWIIKKIRNVEDSEAAAKASEEAAADYADDAKSYMQDAKSAKTQAAIFATQAGNKADDAAASAASIAGVAAQVYTNSSRIDNIIATAGDGTIPTELSDIRVGADGYVYTTAGTAVRSQISKVLRPLAFTETVGAYFNADGTLHTDTSGQASAYTDKIAISDMDKIAWEMGVYTYDHYLWGACCFYDANQNLIGERVQLIVGQTPTEVKKIEGTVEVPKDAAYVAFCYRTYGQSDMFHASVYIDVNNIKSYVAWDNSGGYPGWIRHGTGELFQSASTMTWTFPVSEGDTILAYLKSDNTVIDAAAYFSGDGISQATYMQDSVAWAGNYPTGKWYTFTIPAGCVTAAITSNTVSFTPQILFPIEKVMDLTNLKYTDLEEVYKHNTAPLKIGWNYMYHYGMAGVADRSVTVTIPSESIFDIHNAVNNGYKCIEANVHKTSDDKYVVTHGMNGALGHDFDDLQGNDAYGVVIANNTLADLLNNYRYRSTNPAYRTPITTLEEFMGEAKKCNINVMMQYVDDISLNIARGIIGDDRLFMYNAPRSSYKGMILEYLSYTSTSQILDRCDLYGAPYVYSMANPQDFTDAQLEMLAQEIHKRGSFLASAYKDNATMSHLFELGFDFFAVDGVDGDPEPDVILKGHKIVFNSNGTVTWIDATL